MFAAKSISNQIEYKEHVMQKFPHTAQCLLDWKNKRSAFKLLGSDAKIKFAVVRANTPNETIEAGILLNPLVLMGRSIFAQQTLGSFHQNSETKETIYIHKSSEPSGKLQVHIQEIDGCTNLSITAIESFRAATQNYTPLAWFKKEWMEASINPGRATVLTWSAGNLDDLQIATVIDKAMDKLIAGKSYRDTFAELDGVLSDIRAESSGEEIKMGV